MFYIIIQDFFLIGLNNKRVVSIFILEKSCRTVKESVLNTDTPFDKYINSSVSYVLKYEN